MHSSNVHLLKFSLFIIHQLNICERWIHSANIRTYVFLRLYFEIFPKHPATRYHGNVGNMQSHLFTIFIINILLFHGTAMILFLEILINLIRYTSHDSHR